MLKKIYFLLDSSQKRAIPFLLILTIIATFLEMLGLGMIIPIFTLFLEDNIPEKYPHMQPILDYLGSPSKGKLVTIGMALVISVYLIKSVFLSFYIFLLNKFASNFHVKISERLFKTYLEQPYVFHLQKNSANLIRNISTEILNVYSSLLSVLNFLMEIFILIGFGTILFLSEPMGTILVIIMGCLLAILYSKGTNKIIGNWGKKKVLHLGLATQHLMQGLGGVKDVKLFGRESDFLDKFNQHNKSFANYNRLNTTLQLMPRVWLEFIAVIGLSTLVLSIVLQEKDVSLILPIMAMFGVATIRLIPSTLKVINAVQNIIYNKKSVDIIFEDLKFEVKSESNQRAKKPIPFPANIELQGVMFNYPTAGINALKEISFCLNHGKSLGIIGESGSGKSTLIDVILGLLTPASGKVNVNSIDINGSKASLRNWQDNVGYVPQTIYLTDDTLRRNIAFGLPNEKISEKSIEKSIEIAQLKGFVKSLPEGLNTVVGERGVRLSGGQRQRIGIARAIYHDPSVLVLDEATSALDNETEKALMECIDILENKSKIIVAHRLSTVKNCDIIIHIKKGVIVEKGSPDKVLSI